MVSRREITRAATVDEIKSTALRLMRESGSTVLRFSDIAREMGMTAPALYRYFASRDELLTALIIDAYDDLRSSMVEARDALPAHDVPGRLRALNQAYRLWARHEPERFALIFGLPAAGYTAPVDGPTTQAAHRTFAPYYQLAAVGDAQAQPRLGPVDVPVGEQFVKDIGVDVSPEMHVKLLVAWSALHGFTCLEAFNHLKWLGPDATDALFDALQRSLVVSLGLAGDEAGVTSAPS